MQAALHHTAQFAQRASWRRRALPTGILAPMLRVNAFFQKLLAKSKARH